MMIRTSGSQKNRKAKESYTLSPVSDYYASLSPHDLEEQADWGEFAMREFPKESA
jgi:hypothetical protein